jgi:hypothetical protein
VAVNSFSAKEVGHMGAFVEVRFVAEAKRRVPRFELRRAFEEADDLAVFGIRGHPIPGLRRKDRRAGFDRAALLPALARNAYARTAEVLGSAGLTPALFALLNVVGAREGAIQQRARRLIAQVEDEVLARLPAEERRELLALLRRALDLAPPQPLWSSDEGD